MKAIYWQSTNAVPIKFCKEIIQYAKNKDKSLGVTGGNPKTKDNIKKSLKKRKSNVVWLRESWIYKILNPYIIEANKQMKLNYEVSNNEVCQFTIYEQGHHYGWHQDIWPEAYPETHNDPDVRNKNRKISSVLALNSNDEYEGGVLQIALDEFHTPKRVIEKVDLSTTGSLVVFPSYLWHRVTPVTKGIRYSLVMWTLGADFK